MADRGGIQLLSDARKRVTVAVPGENRLLKFGAIALAVVGVVFAGLAVYTRGLETDLAAFDARLTALDTERQQYESTTADMAAFSRQSARAGTLLANHLFWSKAFLKLQELAQPGFQMSSFSASAPKKEIVAAAHAPSYTAIARQLASFTADDAIKDVSLTNAKSSNQGGLEFGVQIEFDPALLKVSPPRRSAQTP